MEYYNYMGLLWVFTMITLALAEPALAKKRSVRLAPLPSPVGHLIKSVYSDLVSDLNSRGQSFEGSGAYYNHSNAQQGLSWGESYVLISLLNAYEATLDPFWLNTFVKHADGVINQRDDRANRFQKFPVWTTSVSGLLGSSYGLTVDSGMITWPLARFSFLVKNYGLDLRIPSRIRSQYPELSRYGSFQEIANRYSAYAEETLGFHVKREYFESMISINPVGLIRNNVISSSFGLRGFFRPRVETASFFIDTKGRPMATETQLPFNMENSLGITAAYLYGATGKPEHLRVARGLFRNYLDALFPASPSTYYVDYWGIETSSEDLSHGWMNAEFLRVAHETGVWVGQTILGYFARIATEKLSDANGNGYLYFSQVKDDKNNSPDDVIRVFGAWSSMNPFDSRISPRSNAFYRQVQTRYSQSDAVLFLSLTSLLRNSGSQGYGQSCTADSQCSSGVCFGLSSISQMGTCGNFLGDQSRCSRHFECGSGLCSSGFCLGVAKTDGAACTLNSECISGRCSSGVCMVQALSSTGGSCMSDLQCASNGVCVNGTCRVRFALGNGSTCVRDEECASKDCYDNRVCQNRLGVGSNCKVDNDCASGVCYKNQVCAAKLGFGSTCYRKNECISGKCEITHTPPSGQYWRPYGFCNL